MRNKKRFKNICCMTTSSTILTILKIMFHFTKNRYCKIMQLGSGTCAISNQDFNFMLCQ